MASFVRYSADVESIQPDEDETIAELIQTMRSIADTTYRDSGKPLRSVHAKSHGILKVDVEVQGGLPPHLAQGLFARPGRYQGILRLSTNPGDILDDRVSTPRGAALKIIGVAGERLPGSEVDSVQDFVLVNGPAFTAPTAAAFLKNLKLLAKTTDKGEGLKMALSATLRGVEAALEAVGGESPTIKTLGGHPATNILGETFFSQTPFRHGDHIAKIALAPASPELKALTNKPIELGASPDVLRDTVREFFRRNGGEWELRAQLCTDLEKMPVEDASKIWPEDESPYVKIGTVRAAAQDSWTDDNIRAVDECMSFSPWQGLAAHQPLGSVNRARRRSYRAIADIRGQRAGCPMHEPQPA